MCLSASKFRPILLPIEYDQHRSSRSMNAQRRADGRHGFHHGGSVDTALHRLPLTPVCSLCAESLWPGLLFLRPPCCPVSFLRYLSEAALLLVAHSSTPGHAQPRAVWTLLCKLLCGRVVAICRAARVRSSGRCHSVREWTTGLVYQRCRRDTL